jgi:integrase
MSDPKKFDFRDAKLKKLPKPGTGMELYYDTIVPGLMFRITENDARAFVLRYRTTSGRERHYTIGRFSMTSVPEWSVAAARKKAGALKDKIRNGHDPLEALQTEREAPTVKRLIERFTKEHLPKLRPGTRYDYECILEHDITPALGRLKIIEVSPQDIANLHHKVSARAPSRANTVLAVASSLFTRAIKWRLRSDNPCKQVERNKPSERDRVLDDKELGAVWRAAGSAVAPFGAIVRMLALTGQRRDEVTEMTWAEVSDDLATWAIPGSRTKNGKAHIVPLSQPVREILRDSLPEDDKEARRALADLKLKSALVFPGKRGAYSGWSKSKDELDEACKVKGWRLHDLRRTAATGLQRLGVRLEVTEAILNHVSGSRAGVIGVYQRYTWDTEKRAALDAWAAHVIAASDERTPESNVSSFPARARKAAVE